MENQIAFILIKVCGSDFRFRPKTENPTQISLLLGLGSCEPGLAQYRLHPYAPLTRQCNHLCGPTNYLHGTIFLGFGPMH